MKDKNKERLKQKIKELLGDNFDLFDFNAEYDSSLNYQENLNLMQEKVNLLNEDIPELKKESEKVSEGEYKHLLNNHFENFKKESENSFKESLNKILEDPNTQRLENKYFLPRSYIKMIINNNIKGLILFGEGGLGKSYLTLKTLKENNKKIYEDYAYLKGYITTLELYHFLFENKNKLIVLDDINILDNESNLNMLKGCLDNKNRWVSYSTTSEKLKYPKRFLFEGNLILLLNFKPSSNPSLRAVETRVFNYELNFNYKTKIELLHELAKKPYKNLEKKDRFKVVKFLKDNTSEGTINLNFRLLFQLYECYLYDKNNFERLAKGILKEDDDLKLINDLLEKHDQVKQAEQEFKEITGKSRASFWRYKKHLN